MTPLSSSELIAVGRVQQTILAPHAHGSVEGWMNAVVEDVKGVLAAERGACILNLPDMPRVMMEVDPAQQASYLSHYAAIDPAPAMLRSMPQPYATDDSLLSTTAYQEYVQSEAYNDWYLPNGMDQSISIQAYDRITRRNEIIPQFSQELLSVLLFGSSSMAQGKYAATAETILALIQPTYKAAVRMLHQSIASAGGYGSVLVLATLDAVESPTWLFDGDGSCLHQSRAATALVGSLSDGDVLFAGATQLARSLRMGIRRRTPIAHAWALQISGQRIGLVGTLLPDNRGSGPAILVRAEGVAPQIPSSERLRQRFGLTAREADVALLRARGVATAEIAEELCISVHTVRRHTESVMGKLGVHRAAEIGPAVWSLDTNGRM